jgi:hypothetical protein
MARRERVAPAACPERAAEYRAALDALRRLPIEYAGVLRFSGGEQAVMTRETMRRLVAAVDRVAALEEFCRRHDCPACGAVWQLGHDEFRRDTLGPEQKQALNSARFSAMWPGKFSNEWSWWYDRLEQSR